MAIKNIANYVKNSYDSSYWQCTIYFFKFENIIKLT